jgi:hypothetical protein
MYDNPPVLADATGAADASAIPAATGGAAEDFAMRHAQSVGEQQTIARGATDAAAHPSVGTSAIRDDEGDIEVNAS